MKSIRHYLTLRQLAAFGLLFGLGAALLYIVVRTVLVAQFDAALQARAAVLQSFTKQTAKGLEWEPPPANTTPGAAPEQFGLFQIRLTNGATFHRSAALGDQDLPWPAAPGSSGDFVNLTLPNGEPGRAWCLRFTPFADHADRRPAHVREREPKPDFPPVPADLIVAASRAALDTTLRTILMGMAVVGLVFLTGTVLIVALSLRRGLRPLEDLAWQAEQIDAATLQIRFPTARLPAELAPIGSRLNDLLARLEKSFERERQFSADIAHELRTPIGELRALAEVALRLPATGSDTHQDALAIALQMEGIVNRLSDLARCEQDRLPLRLEPVAVAAAVADSWKAFATAAEQRGLTTRFELPPAQRIQTDTVLLRTIITNLLSNAADYTPPGGTVTVELHVSGPRLTLTVANTVDQLTAEDLPHLFERFWRKDSARNSSCHSGLGLSVSEAFARHLGCRLSASLTGGNRLVMTLSGLVPAPAVATEKA